MTDLTFHEAKDAGTVRDANDYLEDHGCASLKRTIGYYGDREFAEQTFVPSLLVVAAECRACMGAGLTYDEADGETRCNDCDGEGRMFTYFPGYRCDDYHGKQEGVFDLSEPCEDAAAAARDAHHIAEREAEKESEYQEKERARMEACESLPDQIRTARKQHTALVIDKQMWRYDTGTMPAAYDAVCEKMAALRAQVARDVKRIRELREQFDFTKE